jgi:hypothetical protein
MHDETKVPFYHASRCTSCSEMTVEFQKETESMRKSIGRLHVAPGSWKNSAPQPHVIARVYEIDIVKT